MYFIIKRGSLLFISAVAAVAGVVVAGVEVPLAPATRHARVQQRARQTWWDRHYSWNRCEAEEEEERLEINVSIRHIT